MLDVSFWNDNEKANKLVMELKELKAIVFDMNSITDNVNDNLDVIENGVSDDILELIEEELFTLKKEVDRLELQTYLNGEYDSCNAVIEIHAGAGGTESCDWANMLYRMYSRYASDNGYKLEELDIQVGEEAGIKSVMFQINGINAYGYLKREKGVHRLVRISPFDSNSRRHTSFASVDITPLFEQTEVDVEINESDLRIDVYRSSGKGGQGVNTTDSAVRITHLPTKIVVTCQNERSQIQNKETALEVLKNKLYNLEIEKRNKELMNIKGDLSSINFGSQIRSYVMHPYSLVKDHRTNTEETNVIKVLDGEIDKFINDNLKGILK